MALGSPFGCSARECLPCPALLFPGSGALGVSLLEVTPYVPQGQWLLVAAWQVTSIALGMLWKGNCSQPHPLKMNKFP